MLSGDIPSLYSEIVMWVVPLSSEDAVWQRESAGFISDV
jgi:hypothetical protein